MNWLKSKKIVAVHSGEFHADDIFSVAVLQIYLDEPLKIVRTRDDGEIQKADYVLDVGRIYNPSENRFDHHQEGGAGARKNAVPYATFGLVWKEFGEKICGSKECAEQVDEKLAQVLDAEDNAFDTSKFIVPNVGSYTVGDCIVRANCLCGNGGEQLFMFERLVKLAVEIIKMEIKVAERFLKDKMKVVTIYNFSEEKEIIVLDGDYDFSILSEYSEPLFVIRPNSSTLGWRVQCVKVKGERFINKLDLPESWAGKGGEDLAKITGVSDAYYCHHERFLALAKSKEGAMELAKLALNSQK